MVLGGSRRAIGALTGNVEGATMVDQMAAWEEAKVKAYRAQLEYFQGQMEIHASLMRLLLTVGEEALKALEKLEEIKYDE